MVDNRVTNIEHEVGYEWYIYIIIYKFLNNFNCQFKLTVKRLI